MSDEQAATERTLEQILASGDRTNSPSYAPAQMILDHGRGMFLYDSEGGEYLDFVAGIAVNALGYAHPRIVETISRLLRVARSRRINFSSG